LDAALSIQSEPAAPAVQLSPDGYWWWDGTNWQPVAQPPARTARRRLPWLRIAAGTTAVVGSVATLVASVLPYGTFIDSNGGPTTTSSIFNGGFAGAGWDIVEPVFVILVAVVAATLVFIGINRPAQAVSAGLLIAVGGQAATMWAAYFGLATIDGSAGAGGVIGILGSLLIFIGGLIALAGLFTPSGAATPIA
jgi:hypothetical protein